jgi:hypothetical protein
VDLSKKFKVSLRALKQLVAQYAIYRAKGPKRVLDSALKAVFTRYKRQAYERHLSFQLTKDQVRSLILSPCHYCGDIESNLVRQHKTEFACNGIDRVDSSLGYFLENCVPCCSPCNWMKLDMTLVDFSKRVCKIAKHFADSEGELEVHGSDREKLAA